MPNEGGGDVDKRTYETYLLCRKAFFAEKPKATFKTWMLGLLSRLKFRS